MIAGYPLGPCRPRSNGAESHDMDEDENRPPDPEVLREMIDAPPIARVVNLIISQAINDRATSAHIDPLVDKLRVRYRVDNRLHDVMHPPKHIKHALVGRIKVRPRSNHSWSAGAACFWWSVGLVRARARC